MSEFQGAGKQPGLQVWRIEKMVPTIWTDHGKFCSGDSYIVLKTTAVPGKSSLSWDIHFWLGEETSQDEAGVAAYKTVELDDLLGGAPVQHREVQHHESDKFLSYFKGGVQYVAGGVDSGFTKVERDVYETRLLQCKGARAVRVSEVPVAASSLNSGDVFIVDCGLTLYQWNGTSANRKEKAKALDVTTNIKDNERGGRAKVVVLDEGKETDEFWTAIGGKGPVSPATDDKKAEEAAAAQLKLFQVSDASGSMQTKEVGSGKLSKSMLDSNDVFIVDCGNEVFVWIGKGANAEERKNGMITASKYLEGAGRPKFTKLTKVNESGETPLFKEKFADWSDMRPPTDFSKPVTSGIAGKREQKDVDVNALLKDPTNPADRPVDDGSGKLKIWRINNFEKEDIPADTYGHFYAGDSYLILYTYMQGTKECYIIYFWQGRDSSQDEKGASAILATKLDDELHGAATQVRVVQGKEPSHFLTLFKGTLIIHSGGTASGFKNKADVDSYDTDGVNLFHVKGTNALNTRAVQVEEKACVLNSGDSFILRTPDTVYLWYGKGCNQDERNAAKKLGDILKTSTVFKTTTDVEEGNEPDKFWNFLGGKDEYASSRVEECPRDPRLFQCSDVSGAFDVEEVYDFSQDDLDANDVFLLDVWTEVFVWVGEKANKKEASMSREIAAQLIKSTSRAEDTPITVVHSGSEPPMFTSAFLGWDHTKAEKFEDPYEKKLRLLAEAKAKEAGEEPPAPASSTTAASADPTSFADPATTTFTYEQLKAKSDPSMCPTKREQYLSDEEFQKVFKMDKAAFQNLKDWKKEQLKKAAGLF